MSLFPVIGTYVPEAANGVHTPDSPGSCSENGPHTHGPTTPSQLLKFGGRVPCSGHGYLDGTPGETENCVDGEKACDVQEDPIDTPHNYMSHSDKQLKNTLLAQLSLPTATCTADTNPHAPPQDMSLTGPPQTDEPLNEVLSGDSQNTTTATGIPSKDTAPHRDTPSADKHQSETEHTEPRSCCSVETEEQEEEKQDEEEREEQHAGNTQDEVTAEFTEEPSAASPGPSSAPAEGESSDSSPCPPHVMAQVHVRNVPERERIVRGMQDSKSLDEISQACGGVARGVGRGGQPEGRRATISSALELEGTVSHDGDLTHFICRNLEQKIKMSSKPSLDCDCESDCSGSISSRGRGSSLRQPADIPPIDPAVLVDLQRHTQDVAHSVELMMRSLNGTIQNVRSVVAGRDRETHGAAHNWPSVIQGRGGNGRQGCSSVGRAWYLQRQGCGFDSHGGPV
ncbi:unnamed protein product [Coregonus sp. 'balchen']|nr:unnamed protein product [Coregonus sp. 'balchen']